MQFNMTMMRKFVQFFNKTDTEIEEDNSPKMDTMRVGTIHIGTPERTIQLALHITQNDRQTLNTAWVVQLVGGDIIVVFHLDHFVALIDTPEMNGLYATVAHEVGHYLAGHFDKKPNQNLDVKLEDQEFFINQYRANPSDQAAERYMRCLLFSLLRGGTNVAELEADLWALKFVPLADLIHIHTLDFKDEKNPFTTLEKVNRIKRLNSYAETNQYKKMQEPNAKRYSLYIEIHDVSNKDNTKEKEEPAALLTE